MSSKEFYFPSVEVVTLDGSMHVPTIVYYYSEDEFLIGHQALEAKKSTRDLHVNFKVDLGEYKSDVKYPKQIPTATGRWKTTFEITEDFIGEVIDYLDLTIRDIERIRTCILVAEPIAMQSGLVSDKWLSNYRANVKESLKAKGFENVQFLPEPFAVFQHYRYNTKHPLLARSEKQYVLVVDFGGGTFDTSIIETTKEGDIRKGGRHSKPLAACSVPYGGYFINECIAIDLYQKIGKDDHVLKTRVNKALRVYRNWRKGIIVSVRGLDDEEFCYYLQDLMYEVEEIKLALSQNMKSWELDEPIQDAASISIRVDPWNPESPQRSVSLRASELRELFINQLWKPYMKKTIGETLSRGKSDIGGGSISVVLLSGGSSNMKWLKGLIVRDFSEELKEASFLPLPDFREVVAKGLAVECARRFWTEDNIGDFSSTTYNRLNLLLNPDDHGYDINRFREQTDGLPHVFDMPAVLLPSASILRKYYGEPLQWKVRLSHPPKHRLEYLFLRSSTNVEDIEPRLNVEETFIDSPPKCSFEKYITVELVVSEDGTTHPKFIYKKGRSEQDRIMVEGRPFMLDITDGTKAHGKINAYVGLDFGTSNTAVSFIDSTTIEVFDERSKDDRYLDLYSLVDALPFPLALPLRRFLSEVDPEKQVKRGLEFIEHAMSLGAYLVHAEYRTGKTRKTKLFKNLSQRSVGPLWSFMQNCLNGIKEDTALSTPLKSLLAGDVYSEVDALVARLVGFKHEKVKVENVKPMKGIRLMASIFNRVFAKAVFGFFEDVQQLPFVSRYAGRFRVAHGAPPFIKHYEFQGPNSFSSSEAFVVGLDEQIAIPLFPLIFWSRCAKHSDLEYPHCYIYDKTSKSGTHTFVAVGVTCPVNPAENQTFAPLVKTIDTLNNSDAPGSKFDDVLLTRREAVD